MNTILEQITIPSTAVKLELVFRGDGNPAHEHEIIGVRFLDKNGQQVGVATGIFPE